MKEQTNSFLSEDTIQINSPKKQSQQFKALFLKNLRLQSKQIGTNICQIFTPIICILFTYLMYTIAKENMPQGALYEPNAYPYKYNNYTYFDELNKNYRDPLQWYIYDCKNLTCDQNMLGINNGTFKSGILGDIPASYPNPVTFHTDPFNNLNTTEDYEVSFWTENNQTTLDKNLYDRLMRIGTSSIKVIKDGGLDALPDAVFNITVLNNTDLEFDVKINDVRDLQYHRTNGLGRIKQNRTIKGTTLNATIRDYIPPYGLLSVIDSFTSSYISTVVNATLQSGYVLMPDLEEGTSFVDTVINFIAILVFPISLSLLFPVFLYTVVLEKEEKLIQMMKMNGMKISSYWFVYFIFNLLLGIITNLIFFFFGYFLLGNRFFTETDFAILFLTLFGWLLAQIGLAVFFQTFLSSARSANIVGYLISIWTCMIGSTLSIGIYQYPSAYPVGLRIFAPFGFVRIVYTLLTVCSDGNCYQDINNIPDELKQCIVFLYLNFFFFFFLGTYLYEIVPQEFGVTRSIFFPFTMIINFFKRCFGKEKGELLTDEITQDPELRQYISKKQQDQFSKEQRHRVLNLQDRASNYPLVINNLRKLYRKQGYDGMYPAVRSFNLKVQKKQTFGLLGPNGAGKTTLISMITGMFEPNFGNAWIGGYSIKKNLEKAQLQMGVCPQFDLLWPQLSVEEHLYFYARLKGIPSSQIDKKVNKALNQVKLAKFRSFPSSSLSGGMKRRLSVAISLVGDPQIVFLDEPSTGLDPDNRRQLWEVLSKCQKHRAIFLTTHMMQEADTLCNRVGIITSGTLRTVNTQNKLKNEYGGGYRMTISLSKNERTLVNRQSIGMMEKGNEIQEYIANEDNEELKKSIDSFVMVQEKEHKMKMNEKINNLKEFMKKQFPKSYLLKNINGCLIYKVPLIFKVSQMFMRMEKLEKELGIADIAITNSSLEDVFMNVVIRFDENFGKQEGQEPKQSEQFFSFTNEEEEKMDEKRAAEENKESSIISKKRESVMSGEGEKK